MATVSVYNHTASVFALGGAQAFDTAVQRCSALTFNAADTTLSGMTFTELSTANGYTQGGAFLQNTSSGIVSTDDGTLDADDVVWTASGSGISATHALVMNYSSLLGQIPLFVIDFGGTLTATAGNDFRIIWDSTDHIIRINKV